MPRRPRLVLPGIPLHVTQRGVNHAAIFFDDRDRLHYRRVLREACAKQGVAIHAFVLMDNHVHLLLTPTSGKALAAAMRHSGQCYVQYFNARHDRSGTLWQGRFKSSIVDSERYLLTVGRYIELNPVRAAMVAAPDHYRWSSIHTHLGRTRDPLVTLHPVYLSLGRTTGERAAAYAQWLQQGIPQEDLAAIRRYIAQERVLGSRRFQEMVAKTLNQPTNLRPRGRPKGDDLKGTEAINPFRSGD